MTRLHATSPYLLLLCAAVFLLRGGKQLVAGINGGLAAAPAGTHAFGYAAGQLVACALMLAAGIAYLCLAARVRANARAT